MAFCLCEREENAVRDKSILFLGKGCGYTKRAETFLRHHFTQVESHLEPHWGQPFPEEARYWRGDLVISYLSRWKVPGFVLESATDAAINFHPAPPERPGRGCTNFALYDEDPFYGVTCHFMTDRIDAGKVIRCERFPLIHPDDTVETVLDRTYCELERLFYRQMFDYLQGYKFAPSPRIEDQWRPENRRTKEDLDRLATITQDLSEDEVRRRCRAVTYREWGPTFVSGDQRFALQPA
jgi:methionyl-tRNA formyltransferase